MSSFDFTLIFCTLNRTDEVADFFSALKRDTPEDLTLQIIVVDQNREDKLSSILAEYRGLWTIEHIRTESLGISPARNLVLDRIAGEFVAFPDDDCMYLDGTLRNVKQYFDLHQEVDALLGVWSGVSAPVFPSVDFEREVNRFTLFKRGEAFVQFYRKRVVDAVGAFDPNFGPGPLALQQQLVGGEDLLLQAQQIEEGIIAPDIGNIYVDHAGYLAFCIFLFPVYIITDFPAENNGHFDEFTFYLILTSWLVFCIVIEEIVKPLIATDF